MAKTPQVEYYYAVGRRKRAVARVRLWPKTGKDANIDITVNDKPVGQFFSDPMAKHHYAQPLTLTDSVSRFRITAKVEGSGPASQLDALLHAMARALVKVDEGFKSTLRQHGLLTRDPRERQRRQIGQGGRARAKKQSPKR